MQGEPNAKTIRWSQETDWRLFSEASRTHDQLRFHLGRAMENGVKKEELIEAITHLAFYCGWPNAMTAVMLAKGFSKSRSGPRV